MPTIHTTWTTSQLKEKCFRENKANIHIMILGLLVDVLDFERRALLGASAVNAYIFTANNSSGNPFCS